MYTGTMISDLMEMANRVIRKASLGQCWFENEWGGCPNTATISSLVDGEQGMQFCPRCWRRLHQ